MEESHQVKGTCLRARSCMRECSHTRIHLASSRAAQSSLEYLLVVALTLAIIVPTTYLFYVYSKESSEEIVDSQITKIGRSIVDAAESIFYSGQGSKTVLELNVPDNINSVSIIDGRELIFNMSTSFGISEIVFFSSVNMTAIGSNCNANTCIIPQLASSGLKKVKIEAINENSVRIETV